MATVGGGFAGVTFAVAAALNGLEVVLFEQSSRLLFAQWKSYDRYLHPRLFDWPDGDWREHHTNHTALAWRDNFAAGVRAVALRQVPLESSLTVELEHHVRRIAPGDSEVEVDLVALKRGTLREVTQRFDRVVLASGFTMERPEYGALGGSYWRTPTDPALVEGPAGVRIVGNGDGALPELITLAIEGFRQDHLRNAVGELDEVIDLVPLKAPRWDHLDSKLSMSEPIVDALGGATTDLQIKLFSHAAKLTEGSFRLNAAIAVAVERGRLGAGGEPVFDPPAKERYGQEDADEDHAAGRTIVWRVGPGATSRLRSDLGFEPAPASGSLDASAAHWSVPFHDTARTPQLAYARSEAQDRPLPKGGHAVLATHGHWLAPNAAVTDRNDVLPALHALAGRGLWLEGVDSAFIDESAVRVVDRHVHMAVDAVGAVASLPASVVMDQLIEEDGLLHHGGGRLFARLRREDVKEDSDTRRFERVALHVAADALAITRRHRADRGADENLPAAEELDRFVLDAGLTELLMLGIRARRRRVGLPTSVLSALQRLEQPGENAKQVGHLLRLAAVAMVPATAGSQARIGLIRLARASFRQPWIEDDLVHFLRAHEVLEGNSRRLHSELLLSSISPIGPALDRRRVLPVTRSTLELWLQVAAPRRGPRTPVSQSPRFEAFIEGLRDFLRHAQPQRGEDLLPDVARLANSTGTDEFQQLSDASRVVLVRFGLRAAHAS